MKEVIIDKLFRLYKNTVSLVLRVLFGKGCRYYPTCSEYATDTITKYGIIKGTVLTVKRLLSCHPYSQKAYFDPVK